MTPWLSLPSSIAPTGGLPQSVRFCVSDCWLGKVLVGATPVGVCAIFFGREAAQLQAQLRQRFPDAELQAADDHAEFARWVDQVLEYIDAPHQDFPLPLDVAGTAFQQRVWTALREVPAGRTASYAQIAAAIGQPSATRAVAGACGANPVAVAVPCHRIVRQDGKLSGYRWGVSRKRALLDREAESTG